jgi:SAM-dependent methyltransferase
MPPGGGQAGLHISSALAYRDGRTMSKSTVRSHGAGYELDTQVLRQSMIRRLPKRLHASCNMRLPAVPALTDHYTDMLAKLFALQGRVFSATEIETMRDLLRGKIEEGFALARNSYVLVKYQTDEPPKLTLSYTFSLEVSSVQDEYAGWVQTRTAPLFGNHPDCKVMDVARSLGTPADVPVLDIGAGTGRNTLPLARAGFPTDAVELSPDLAKILREAAEKDNLPIRLFEGDVLNTPLEVPKQRYRLIILCEVVSDFRDVAAVNRLFERAAELIAPGGTLLFNAFLPVGGYQPDPLARQLSFVLWSTIFLRDELRDAAKRHGFVASSEESVYEYEKERLPESAWPPTGWFEEWTRGVDTFDIPMSKSPVEMRWLTFKKQ